MPQTDSVADRQPSFPIKAIVRVGNSGGRGFIVSAADNSRYIITAAHCIDRERYPSASLFDDINKLTFPKFVGSLAKRSRRSIWGGLCVLSLIDDIAVFCAPDSQELSEQCEASTSSPRRQ